MEWQEVCERYPAQWVVVEILSWRADADARRYATEMEVVAAQYPDSRAAYLRCRQLRYRHVGREFYSTHTSLHVAWWTSSALPARRTPEPGEIEALYHDLRAEDYHVRHKAGYLLMHLDPPPLGWLLAALQDEDWRMRASVVFLLAESGQPGAVVPLLALLSNPHPPLRWEVAHYLGGFEDPRALRPLIGCLQDPDPQLRWCAAASLGKLRDPRAIKPLLRALQEENGVVRSAAAEALGTLGARQAVMPLIACLRDEVAVVRQMAARALGRLGDKQAISPLLDQLQDPDYCVRDGIFHALGELGEQSVLAPLQAAHAVEPHREVRLTASEAIERIEARLRGQMA